MSSVRSGEEMEPSKTRPDNQPPAPPLEQPPHQAQHTPAQLSLPQVAPQGEVIEISDDEIEVTNVRPTRAESGTSRPRRRRSPRRVVNIEEDDDDDLLITGSNPSPAPLPGTLPPQSPQNNIDDFDGEIEIINERPIARPPPSMLHGPTRNGPRRPVLPPFNRINSMVHTHFGSHGHQRSRNGIRSRVWLPFSSTGRNVRGRRPDAITENHLAEYINTVLQRQQDAYPEYEDYPFGDSDAIENSIMTRIERENETAMDQRLANENIFNRKVLQEKKEQASNEKHGYTNDISPSKSLGCELCGVILGEGIPYDFKPDSRYNESFEKYVKEYRVQAPWFCTLQCTEADVDLSKRIFASKCGHVFCGRCVRNIANRPRRTKNSALIYSITNPMLVSPPKCPGPNCNKKFTAKNFLELYY